MAVRIFVTGSLLVVWEGSGAEAPPRVDEPMLPGRQGRLVLAMLAVEHRRQVSREELAEQLWPADLPRAWDVAVRAVISKTRASLEHLGTPLIDGAFGAYRWRMPPDGWLVFDESMAAVHRAESALRAGDLAGAAGDGLAAAVISGRPFLAGIPPNNAVPDRRRRARAAARTYQEFRQLLMDDLEVEPSDETLLLRRQMDEDRQAAD